jgi:hypothetical protein
MAKSTSIARPISFFGGLVAARKAAAAERAKLRQEEFEIHKNLKGTENAFAANDPAALITYNLAQARLQEIREELCGE